MKFSEVVEQASALLQRKGRMTYRALKREFALDEDALADLKFELITGQEVAVDKDGEVLVWVGDGEATPTPPSPPVQFQPPVSYTPSHLAERIRAEQAALEARGRAGGLFVNRPRRSSSAVWWRVAACNRPEARSPVWISSCSAVSRIKGGKGCV